MSKNSDFPSVIQQWLSYHNKVHGFISAKVTFHTKETLKARSDVVSSFPANHRKAEGQKDTQPIATPSDH